MSYIIEKPYVYVVLEHAEVVEGDEIIGPESFLVKDCVLHGIYTDREMAEGKKKKIQRSKLLGDAGYISILKKPLNGKIRCYQRCLYLNNWYDTLEG